MIITKVTLQVLKTAKNRKKLLQLLQSKYQRCVYLVKLNLSYMSNRQSENEIKETIEAKKSL